MPNKNQGDAETWLGYTGENCINCGRDRVEISSKGKKVCEKCGMNQDTKEFEYDKYI